MQGLQLALFEFMHPAEMRLNPDWAATLKEVVKMPRPYSQKRLAIMDLVSSESKEQVRKVLVADIKARLTPMGYDLLLAIVSSLLSLSLSLSLRRLESQDDELSLTLPAATSRLVVRPRSEASCSGRDDTDCYNIASHMNSTTLPSMTFLRLQRCDPIGGAELLKTVYVLPARSTASKLTALPSSEPKQPMKAVGRAPASESPSPACSRSCP
jgi:hypothetical protein